MDDLHKRAIVAKITKSNRKMDLIYYLYGFCFNDFNENIP